MCARVCSRTRRSKRSITILGDTFSARSLDDTNGGSFEYEDRDVVADGIMVRIDELCIAFILVLLFGIGVLGISDGSVWTGSMFTVGQGHESHSHEVLTTLA